VVTHPQTAGGLFFRDIWPGVSLASVGCMSRLATIDVWSDDKSGKRCRLTVSDSGCEVEIRAEGERLLTAWYSSLAEAWASARERQPGAAFSGPPLAA
jgi:hypothetical protein